jgi:hypothetical protein
VRFAVRGGEEMISKIIKRAGRVQLRESVIRHPDGQVVERHYIVMCKGVQYHGPDLDSATAAFEQAAAADKP